MITETRPSLALPSDLATIDAIRDGKRPEGDYGLPVWYNSGVLNEVPGALLVATAGLTPVLKGGPMRADSTRFACWRSREGAQ